jgi:hypothetical protein
MTEQRMRDRNAERSTAMTTTTITLPPVKATHVRLGALVALGLAAFLIGWLVLGRGDNGGSSATNGATPRSESELREFAASSSHPVYWAGPRSDHTYELTKTTDGRVFVRYLPSGVDAGDPRPDFLTIGTYPRRNAYSELKRAAKAPGAQSRSIGQGGIAVLSRGSSSVYFGYPDAAYQVEVYAPGPGSARQLVLGGQVVPIR